MSIFTPVSEMLLMHGVEQAGHTFTEQDLLNSIPLSDVINDNKGCWKNLKFVIYCRNTTLLNVKNVLDMLELQGKHFMYTCSITLKKWSVDSLDGGATDVPILGSME